MPVFSDGQKISETEWARLIQSVPASYVVWKDGSTYRAECLLKGGTDYSGTDAATVIQSAIDALTNGGKIFIKAGTYYLSSTVEQKDNITIVGYGAKLIASDTLDPLWMVHGSHTRLYGLELDGNYLVTTVLAVRKLSDDTCDYSDVIIRDCIIKNVKQDTGLWLLAVWDGSNQWNLKEVIIEGNMFEDSSEKSSVEAIIVSFGYDVVIKNNVLLKIGSYGIQAFRSKHIKIIGNYIEPDSEKDITAIKADSYDVMIEKNSIKDANYGIIVVGQNYASSGMHGGNVRVKNNFVLSTKFPIQVYGGVDDDLEDVIVEGNIFEGKPDTNSEIYFANNPSEWTGNLSNFKFINNIVRDLGHGISVYSHINDYPIIEDNIIMNFGRYTSDSTYLRSGVRISNNAKAIIRGNRFVDLQETPTSYYAVYEYDEADASIIENNTIEGMVSTQAIRIANASTVVKRNIGFKTENSGTATISSSTYVDVTHGLAGTPTTINVTPATSGTGDWYLSNIGASTFRINVANSGTYTFHWTAEYKP